MYISHARSTEAVFYLKHAVVAVVSFAGAVKRSKVGMERLGGKRGQSAALLWIAAFLPIPRTRRLGGTDAEKSVALNDQVEHGKWS